MSKIFNFYARHRKIAVHFLQRMLQQFLSENAHVLGCTERGTNTTGDGSIKLQKFFHKPFIITVTSGKISMLNVTVIIQCKMEFLLVFFRRFCWQLQ